MFELIGLMVLRAVGFGWAWGRDSHRAMQASGGDVFGNGGPLLGIGLGVSAVIVGVVFLMAKQ